MDPNHQPTLTNPEFDPYMADEDRPFYLVDYDDDELLSYAAYLKEHGLEDNERSAMNFEGDY